jgi:hypothetical protein
MATRAYPLSKERNLILGLLLILAAAAWAILVWQAGSMEEDSMGLTMGMSVPLFVALWAAMMVAIMFPTAAPMILTFARVQRTRQERSEPFVPTWLFTGSYIGLWSATGLFAYAAARFGDSLADNSTFQMSEPDELHPDELARWPAWSHSHGLRACYLLSRMLLAALRNPISVGHDEHRGLRDNHGAYLCGEITRDRTHNRKHSSSRTSHLWNNRHYDT